MWVNPHQKSEKCSEFPRFSFIDKTTLYTVEFNDGNPRNPNGMTVDHLDMNYYTVKFLRYKPTETRD